MSSPDQTPASNTPNADATVPRVPNPPSIEPTTDSAASATPPTFPAQQPPAPQPSAQQPGQPPMPQAPTGYAPTGYGAANYGNPSAAPVESAPATPPSPQPQPPASAVPAPQGAPTTPQNPAPQGQPFAGYAPADSGATTYGSSAASTNPAPSVPPAPQPQQPMQQQYPAQQPPAGYSQPGPDQSGFAPASYAQPGYANPGGYHDPAAAPYAGYAQPAAAPAHSGSNPITVAALSWWSTFKNIYQGRPELPSDPTNPNAPTPALTWVLAVVGNGLLLGFAACILLARTASDFGMFLSPSFGDYLLYFLLPVVGTALFAIARTGALALLFRIMGTQTTFTTYANLSAIGFIAASPVAALSLLVGLLPNDFTVIVAAVCTLFVLILGEVSTFVAVNNIGRFTKPVALHYAWVMTAWWALSTFVLDLVMGDTLGGVLGALLFY